jgi:cyclohexadienyl dehydratase
MKKKRQAAKNRKKSDLASLAAWRFALVSLALLSACSPPHVSAVPDRGSPAAPAAVAKRIEVGTSGDYGPFSVAHGERFDGFAPTLVRAFASSHGMDVSWMRFRWPDLGGDMQRGRFELVADGITVRPERSIAGRFTVPIARGGAMLLVRRPSWAPPLSAGTARAGVIALDRTEFRIAVNAGAHLERVTRRLFQRAEVRAIPDNTAVRGTLARGEVDAVMTNTFEAPRWAEGLFGVEHIGPLTNDITALWVRADRESMSDELDGWLLDEEESGRLSALRAKELGAGAGPKAGLAVSALSAAIAERLSLMPFVAAAKRRRGLAIEDSAQETRVLAAARAEVARAAHGERAPTPEAIDAFFRVQIDAAKGAQGRDALPSTLPEYDLDHDLRPAIARITAREARVIVRLKSGLDVREVEAELERDLESLEVAPGVARRFAAAIVALSER